MSLYTSNVCQYEQGAHSWLLGVRDGVRHSGLNLLARSSSSYSRSIASHWPAFRTVPVSRIVLPCHSFVRLGDTPRCAGVSNSSQAASSRPFTHANKKQRGMREHDDENQTTAAPCATWPGVLCVAFWWCWCQVVMRRRSRSAASVVCALMDTHREQASTSFVGLRGCDTTRTNHPRALAPSTYTLVWSHPVPSGVSRREIGELALAATHRRSVEPLHITRSRRHLCMMGHGPVETTTPTPPTELSLSTGASARRSVAIGQVSGNWCWGVGEWQWARHGTNSPSRCHSPSE
jgi:hypothetical protein